METERVFGALGPARPSKPTAAVIGVVLLVAVAALDYVIGYEVGLSVLYVGPIFLLTRKLGLRKAGGWRQRRLNRRTSAERRCPSAPRAKSRPRHPAWNTS